MTPQATTAGRNSRTALAAVLLLSLALNAIPLWWGLPSHKARTWAFDEIPTHHDGQSLRTRHHGRYPPLHYLILRTAYRPIRMLGSKGIVELDHDQMRTTLQLIGRSLSVLLATMTIGLVYLISRLLFDQPVTALLAATSAALVVPFVFFAKTINLEAPYVFWFTLSLWFFVRIQKGHRTLDYLAFGAAMAFAITTKDQAFALYVLVPVVLVVDLHRYRAGQGDGSSSLVKALFDPRLVGSAVVAVVLFAMVHELFTDWGAFVRHVQIITGKASQPSRMFDHSVGGHVHMLVLAVRHIAFSMGWPLLLAAVVGAVLAWRDRNRVLLSLLIFPASYYLFFIVPILYHRVRYFLPFCIVLSFFAAQALTWLMRRPASRPWLGRAAVALLLVYSFLRPVSFIQEMLFDSRYDVEAWMGEQSDDSKVVFIGHNRPLLPRGRTVRSLDRAASEGAVYLRKTEADFVVVNEGEGAAAQSKEFLEALTRGDLNFRLLFRQQYQPWPFRLDRSGLATNLVTVNPLLAVLEREDPWELYSIDGAEP